MNVWLSLWTDKELIWYVWALANICFSDANTSQHFDSSDDFITFGSTNRPAEESDVTASDKYFFLVPIFHNFIVLSNLK